MLVQLFKQKPVFENSLNRFYQLGAEGKGVAQVMLTPLQRGWTGCYREGGHTEGGSGEGLDSGFGVEGIWEGGWVLYWKGEYWNEGGLGFGLEVVWEGVGLGFGLEAVWVLGLERFWFWIGRGLGFGVWEGGWVEGGCFWIGRGLGFLDWGFGLEGVWVGGWVWGLI